jgi:hypothetical protein
MNGRRYKIRVKQSRSEELGIWECWQDARPARHKEALRLHPGMHSCTPLILLSLLRCCWVWGQTRSHASVGSVCIRFHVQDGGIYFRTSEVEDTGQNTRPYDFRLRTLQDTARGHIPLLCTSRPQCNPTRHCTSAPTTTTSANSRSTWTLRAFSHAHSTIPRVSIRIHSPQYHRPPH